MNRDTTIGIVGCAILVAAMIGVFTYERATAQASGAGIATRSVPIVGPTVDGSVQLGKSDTKIANITATSATNVTFHLTWQATNGKDSLKITVAPPTGSGITEGAVSGAQDSGDISVTVRVPAGASPAGGWQVKVEFTNAAPAAMPGGIQPPTPPPNSTDASVTYHVATSIS